MFRCFFSPCVCTVHAVQGFSKQGLRRGTCWLSGSLGQRGTGTCRKIVPSATTNTRGTDLAWARAKLLFTNQGRAMQRQDYKRNVKDPNGGSHVSHLLICQGLCVLAYCICFDWFWRAVPWISVVACYMHCYRCTVSETCCQPLQIRRCSRSICREGQY